MRVIATKSLIFWPCACWSEGCFFDHWRSDMAFSLVTGVRHAGQSESTKRHKVH